MRRPSTSIVLSGLVLVATACGDDSTPIAATTPAAPTATQLASSTADTVAATGGVTESELCRIVEEVNSTDEFPTVEQMDRYYAAAPPELQAPVEIVMDAVKAADGDFTVIFSEPDASAALEQITELEAELCGTETGADQDPSVTEVDETATRVDVAATDYAYAAELPDAPGRYSFVMRNAGEEMHIMVLIRLENGVSLDTALESQGEEGVAEEYSSAPAGPGADAVIAADLGQGTWVLLCPIPGPEGHPHFVDGMIEEFEIT